MKALLEEFRALPDYRKNKVGYTHPGEILFLSLLAVMSGAQGYDDIASWMQERKRELARFLGRAFIAPAYTTYVIRFWVLMLMLWRGCSKDGYISCRPTMRH